MFSLVDGKYTEWVAWGECSKTCGEGRKRRKRECTAPKPDFGGKTCAEQKLGETAETASCDLGPCPSKYGVRALTILKILPKFLGATFFACSCSQRIVFCRCGRLGRVVSMVILFSHMWSW